ncbi:MAG: tripartite tricarboxylate transporter TctB family protein [Rhizobiales bacterium]|nr:tripartite tricarboxylate transporter TctB family protein [Hyphomicrobiales bacterium]
MDENKPSPIADFVTGAVWLALAVAIIIGAWKMDRLEHLQTTIYTMPGSMAALLGGVIGLMAIILMLRSILAGALAGVLWQKPRWMDHWRLIAVLVLCLGYAIGLVGHGLPFWLGSAIFVAVFVFIFQFADRRRDGTLIRGAAFAIVLGLISSFAIHYAFQDVFLVRLP